MYKYLVEDSDESWTYGLFAFAIFEEWRIEWQQHWEKQTGSAPTQEDIDHWYLQQPESSVVRARGEAETALAGYSSETVEEALRVETDRIKDSTVISEIRLARRLWPQIGVSVVGGVASAIVFAALLIVLLLIVQIDPSPLDIVKGAVTEETTDGEADSEPRSD